MRDGWDEFVRSIVDAVKTKLPNAAEPEIWVAKDQSKKRSCHLIWNVWFPDLDRLKTFVVDLKREKLNDDDRIDVAPYHANKSLRCPYNSKRRFPLNVMVPIDDRTGDFDQERFLKSLLQAFGTPSTTDFGEERAFSSSRIPSGGGGDGGECDPRLVVALERLETWIRTIWDVRYVKRKKEPDEHDEWVWHLSPGIWCPHSKRFHSSNTTMLRGHAWPECEYAYVETLCLDETDCPHEWVRRVDFDFSRIMFPSQKKKHDDASLERGGDGTRPSEKT